MMTTTAFFRPEMDGTSILSSVFKSRNPIFMRWASHTDTDVNMTTIYTFITIFLYSTTYSVGQAILFYLWT